MWQYVITSFFRFCMMNVDCSILPAIVTVRQKFTSHVSCYGIVSGVTEINAGLGDLQCSIKSCNPADNEAGKFLRVLVQAK